MQPKDNQLRREPKEPPKCEVADVFYPKIYLSIVISGLPPDNSLQLVIQNTRLDRHNLKDLMRTIEYRLSTIEHSLKKSQSKQQKD